MPDVGKVPYGPGRFYARYSCRCGECEIIAEAGVVTRLERVGNSPDADQPGDFVAMIVEEVMFPDGWGLSADMKPRCPDHLGKVDD